MSVLYCARCRRPAPPETSDALLYWEALGDGSEVICDGCVTGQEPQEMDEATFETEDAAAAFQEADE